MTATGPQHHVIRASAGAGKTFALSTRYLRLMFNGAAPEIILATTFTRKAAGEILGRVLQRLAKGASDRASAAKLAEEIKEPGLTLERTREMLQMLARSMHRVSISTIDRFFNRMAQSFRLELGIPPDPELVAGDDPLAVRVRREAIDALLAEADPGVMVDLLRRAHHDAASRSVTEAIDRIVSNLYEIYRQAPDEATWSRLPVGSPVSKAKVSDALALLTRILPGLTNKTVSKSMTKNLEMALAADWPGFLSNGIAAKVALGEGTFSRWPIPDDIAAAMGCLVAHAKHELLARLAGQTRATFELLERFDAHFTRLAAAHRLVLFSDLPYRLARGLPALSEPDQPGLDELYYRLDSRVAHLLLDEFQDTSPLQWEVLRPLAQEIAAHGDGTRSFFCVGDIKQAIYGWRGGCAELFDEVESDLHLSHESRLSLNKSYRSSQVVLDAVNQVFSSLDQSPAFSRDERLRVVASQWEKGFAPHTAQQVNLPGYVELTTSVAPPADEPESAEVDADEETPKPAASTHLAFVARRVAELVRKSPGKTFGVLAGTNRTVNELIYLLKLEHVDASGEGGNPVTDDPAVGAVLAAMRLADHPGDATAAFHLLHSPLGPILGLTRLDGGAADGLSLRIRARLAAEGYAEVVAGWARSLAEHCDRRNVVRLGQLVALVDEFEPQATLRPGDFVRFAEARRVEEPNPAAVRVMTVHKSKGLEFDVVVLPELDRKLDPGNEMQAYIVRDRPAGPATAVYRAARKELRSLSPELDAGYWQERTRRLRDDLCGLYVAMTRARQALHMVIRPLRPTKSGEPGAHGLADLCHATILRGALSAVEQEDMAGGQTLYTHGQKDWAGDASPARTAPASPPRAALRLEPIKREATRSWRVIAPSQLEAGSRVVASDLLLLEPAEGKRRGTVIHALLATVEFLPAPEDETLLAAASAAAPEVEPATLRRWVGEFRQMLSLPAVAARLTRPAEKVDEKFEVWNERNFMVRSSAGLVRGSFDRVTVHRVAGRVIGANLVDFKTDRVDLNDAGSIGRTKERYRPQIEAYRAALATVLGIDAETIAAELLLMGSGEVVPL